jgi:hypothetical protein
MKNEEDNFFERKQDRRKKFQNKSQKKDWNNDEHIINKKTKHEIKEKKEHLEEEEWEDWDRYYNH